MPEQSESLAPPMRGAPLPAGVPLDPSLWRQRVADLMLRALVLIGSAAVILTDIGSLRAGQWGEAVIVTATYLAIMPLLLWQRRRSGAGILVVAVTYLGGVGQAYLDAPHGAGFQLSLCTCVVAGLLLERRMAVAVCALTIASVVSITALWARSLGVIWFLTWSTSFAVLALMLFLPLQYVVQNLLRGLDDVQAQLGERRRAEQALRASEARFRTLVEDAPVALGIGRDGVSLYANRAYLELFGFDRLDEIVGRPIAEQWSPAWRSIITERARDRTRGLPVPPEYEGIAQRRDGSQFPVHVAVTAVDLPDGRATMGFITDLTARKQAENELRASQANLFALIESTNDLIWSVDRDYRLITFNCSLDRHFQKNYGTHARIGDSSFDFLPPDRAARWPTLYARALAEGPYHLEYDLTDGRVLDLAFNPIVADGKAVGVAVFGKDTTERKRAEQLLRESEEHFRILSEASLEGLLIHDQGVILDANQAFARLFGYAAPEELIGRNAMGALLTPESSARIAQRIKQRDTGPLEVSCVRKDGSVFVGETVSRVARYMGREARFVSCRDITERKRTQEVLLESEKLRTVAGLAAGVAHEINNPLGAMVQNTQVVLNRLTQDLPANRQAAAGRGITFEAVRGFAQDRGIPEALESIRRAGERASHIVRNLLTYSRPDAGTVLVNLKDLVEQTLDLAASDYELSRHHGLDGVEVVREYAPDTPALRCHPGQIQQVLLNLVRNAVQALRERAGPGRPRLYLRTSRQPGYGCLEVEDNGPGISPELRPRLFEPFFTTKPVGQGTGLGLFVCYHIVTVTHGGQVSVTSQPNEKTCFTIRLPLGDHAGAVS